MQLISTFGLLLLQLSSLAAASPLRTTRESTPVCDLTFTYPTLGSCPTGCCGWGFRNLTESSGWLCQGTGTYAAQPASNPTGFVDKCKALQDTVNSEYFTWWLTSDTPKTWYEAISNDGCSLQFNFDEAIDSDGDGPHIGNGDLAQWLTEGISTTKGGTMDSTGYSTCYSYSLQWRMVPK
ncbi:hypothetical protein PG994_001491 [Apiospora phragmitis]|uniref:Ecp2 effector protein-like domain-containing protein n=1 Tax=Apiospora phragmitis TaxID=2905665 RepID=A0ABR1WTR8_9PEZI